MPPPPPPPPPLTTTLTHPHPHPSHTHTPLTHTHPPPHPTPPNPHPPWPTTPTQSTPTPTQSTPTHPTPPYPHHPTPPHPHHPTPTTHLRNSFISHHADWTITSHSSRIAWYNHVNTTIKQCSRQLVQERLRCWQPIQWVANTSTCEKPIRQIKKPLVSFFWRIGFHRDNTSILKVYYLALFLFQEEAKKPFPTTLFAPHIQYLE